MEAPYDPDACTSACTGSPGLACGGPDALSMYQLPPVPPFRVIGCFNDGAGGTRRLPALLADDPDGPMSHQRCARMAHAAGHTLFAVQYYYQCWGGHNEARAVGLGPSNACDTPCSAEERQMCGGANVFNLFSFHAPIVHPLPALPPHNHLGCFADDDTRDPDARRLTELLEDGFWGPMSVERCAGLAMRAGLPLFAVQYYYQCWGSDDLERAMSLGPSQACNMACTDDPEQACGGDFAFNLYQFPDTSYRYLAAPVPTFHPMGCFRDDASGSGGQRRLAVLLSDNQDGPMTHQHCARLAMEAGYVLFGVQSGYECWGGYSAPRATSLGASDQCGAACVSDPSQTCGGDEVFDLFSF